MMLYTSSEKDENISLQWQNAQTQYFTTSCMLFVGFSYFRPCFYSIHFEKSQNDIHSGLYLESFCMIFSCITCVCLLGNENVLKKSCDFPQKKLNDIWYSQFSLFSLRSLQICMLINNIDRFAPDFVRCLLFIAVAILLAHSPFIVKPFFSFDIASENHNHRYRIVRDRKRERQKTRIIFPSNTYIYFYAIEARTYFIDLDIFFLASFSLEKSNILSLLMVQSGRTHQLGKKWHQTNNKVMEEIQNPKTIKFVSEKGVRVSVYALHVPI